MGKEIEELSKQADEALNIIQNDRLYDSELRHIEKYIAALEAAQPRWISVKERLPETGKKVLWQGVRDNYQFVGSLHEKMNLYCIAVVPGLLHGLPEVTHWMNLPPAPEEEE